LGYAIAVDGDVAVAGAYREGTGGNYAGAAYIFERDFNGVNNWNEVKKISASDAGEFYRFGDSVAVDGDVVIVGATGADTVTNYTGAAYIFERNFCGTNTWKQVKKLIAADAHNEDSFGYSVAVNGDVAVVGAYREDSGGINSGAAYIFERNFGGTNNWGQVKKIVASDAQAKDSFGYQVDVAGDVIIAGAFGDDSFGTNSGAAYIFERNFNGTNNWGQVKKIMDSDPKNNAYFGYSVAVEGNVIVVGARQDDSIEDYAGAAYVFERSTDGKTNNWGEVKKLTADDADTYDFFGNAVSVAGDIIVVGAENENSGGNGAGAAYIFQRNYTDINEWKQINKLTASDAKTYKNFGWAVAAAADVVIIGADDDDELGLNTGAIYIFEELGMNFPKVDNVAGAGNITETSATLNGRIIYSGCNDPAVTIFWGDNDAGIITGNWEYYIDIGVQTNSFSTIITNLQPNTKYYYRCYATNSGGAAWADETASFTTFDFPFINITNKNKTVTYDIKTYTIAGTNNLAVVGGMNWSNSLTGESGTIQVSGVGFQVSGINLSEGANAITVSGTNILGTTTNDTFTITRGGAGTGLPFINITNENKTVTYDVSTYTIAGTNNVNVVGGMNWTNSLTAISGTIPISNFNFQISNFDLSVGENIITVSGTNIYGTATNDTITITRGGAGTGLPFVDITNENKTVTYDVKTYTINGTNNANVVGGMNWTNALTEASGNATISNFNFQISNFTLAAGENIITVLGTNIHGDVASDSVTITRGGAGTGLPFVDITNENKTVTYDVKTYTISGTNNANVVGGMNWTNELTEASGNATISNFNFQLSNFNLTVGENIITVSGTNIFGAVTNDTIKITREPKGKLIASDAQPEAGFGISVDIADGLALVGAFRDSVSGNCAGAAYIFKKNTSEDVWKEMGKLVAADARESDEFGGAVALSANIAVIGAKRKDINGSEHGGGAAYIFEQNSGSTNPWEQVKKLVASDAQENDWFGCSVASDGDVVIIGANGEDEGGEVAGAAYIFERHGGGSNSWGETKKLIASDAQNSDLFGCSVAIAGDIAVVGANLEDSRGPDAGSAYVFERNFGGSNNWGQVKKLIASDAQANDQFGLL